MSAVSTSPAPPKSIVARDIEIHGGVNNWYLEVQNPPRSYRIDIGYLSRNGQFYALARSNVVSTPRAGISDVIDENWADLDTAKADRIYAMSGGFDPTASSLELKQLFEERLRRPMGSPAVTSFGSGAFQYGKSRQFWFQLDAELIVYGATEPTAKVTLQGEPVKLRSDGTFTMRFSLPDSRQIIPAVAASADGIEERTIVLAIERNTKHLEPMIHRKSMKECSRGVESLFLQVAQAFLSVPEQTRMSVPPPNSNLKPRARLPPRSNRHRLSLVFA